MKKMKIKELPKDFNMVGSKLNGQYIVSGWNKGFWVKNNLEDSQLFPIFFNNFDEIKDWVLEIPYLQETRPEIPSKEISNRFGRAIKRLGEETK